MGPADDCFEMLAAYLCDIGAQEADEIVVVAYGASWVWNRNREFPKTHWHRSHRRRDIRLSQDIALGSCELLHPQSRSRSVHKSDVALFGTLTHLAHRISSLTRCAAHYRFLQLFPLARTPCDSNSLHRGQGMPEKLGKTDFPVWLGIQKKPDIAIGLLRRLSTGFKKIWAVFYSPTPSPEQYHRR